MQILTRNFFRGVIFLAPIGLTVYIFYSVFRIVDKIGLKLFGHWLGDGALQFGAGFAFTLTLIVLMGYLSSLWFGAIFLDWIENQFLRSPVAKGIYTTIRQVLDSILGEEKIFHKVVLVRFPNLGFKRIGFITQESPLFAEKGSEDIIVYFPHSFQISGNMLVVPRSNVEEVKISPEAALKMIMSGGLAK